jgi:hypothetical protein
MLKTASKNNVSAATATTDLPVVEYSVDAELCDRFYAVAVKILAKHAARLTPEEFEKMCKIADDCQPMYQYKRIQK